MVLFQRSRPLVVIVCTANITRSPYFAGRLRQELEQTGLPPRKLPEITSAGIAATNGVAAHPVMQTIAHDRGFSLGNHQAKRFDSELAEKAQLVLTMEQIQAEQIRRDYPEHAANVSSLLEFGRDGSYDGPVDIEDPTGGEIEDFMQYVNLADAQAQRLRRFFRKHGTFLK